MTSEKKITQYELMEFKIEDFIKIAEDFAIDFSEFCASYLDKNRNHLGEMLHAKSKYDDTYTTKELLEIYKKEKL